MKRALALALMSLFVFGCGLTTTTGMDGLRYGMSQPVALKVVERAGDEIVTQSETEIVAIGMWSTINQVRRKVLTFENGKLASVAYEPLEESEGNPSIRLDR